MDIQDPVAFARTLRARGLVCIRLLEPTQLFDPGTVMWTTAADAAKRIASGSAKMCHEEMYPYNDAADDESS